MRFPAWTPTREIASGALLLTIAGVARRRRVDPPEAEVFRAVNAVPDVVEWPVRITMQAGALGAAFAAAGAAALAGRRRLAVRLAAGGTAAWAGSKVVKRAVGRGRPADHLDAVVIRGTAQRGLGFPSGHAAVVTTLAAIAAPELPRPVTPVLWGVVATTCFGRMYVGAHLPADIVGGVALGVLCAGAAQAVDGALPHPALGAVGARPLRPRPGARRDARLAATRLTGG